MLSLLPGIWINGHGKMGQRTAPAEKPPVSPPAADALLTDAAICVIMTAGCHSVLLREGRTMIEATDCGMLVKLISDSIARISNNELRENDLTLSQLRYLEYLYAHSDAPTPFKELESYFQVSQPTVAGIIRRLEGKGLILTQASKSGGKARTAALTAAGTQQYEAAEARRSETEALLLAPLDEAGRKQFHTMLRQIYQNLKEV